MRETGTSEFNVALLASAAIGLFTPEGERAWIPGWDPVVLKEYAPAQFQARAAELAGLIEAFLRSQR